MDRESRERDQRQFSDQSHGNPHMPVRALSLNFVVRPVAFAATSLSLDVPAKYSLHDHLYPLDS